MYIFITIIQNITNRFLVSLNLTEYDCRIVKKMMRRTTELQVALTAAFALTPQWITDLCLVTLKHEVM